MLPVDSSLGEIQAHLGRIYTKNNDRLFQTYNLPIMLQHSANFTLKGVRKKDFGRIVPGLVESVGWMCAIGTRLGINIESQFLKHFPGVCPYCACYPCQPALHDARGRKRLDDIRTDKLGRSFLAQQNMLAQIYPENTLEDSARHLGEEVGEVSIALCGWEGTHERYWLGHVGLELADVVANICAVASCAKIDLPLYVIDTYQHGCPRCKSPVCSCEFSVVVPWLEARKEEVE